MESISRISSMIDPVRDLTAEAAQAVGVSKLFKSGSSSKSISFAKLKALLDSRSDKDILEGLRKVVAMMYQSKPCLAYFSSVVKNVANPNIEIKKLVYIYLLHYAESDPDLALLSVNAIQKSLTDQNPQVRAMALRTMSGMRVPVISQIVSLAIKRGVGDMSPHVRKAAALAIPKCYRLDPQTLPQLLDYLSALLGDKQYFVVGSAVSAYLDICPERMDLIHPHYRSLVKKLVDMDEWGQLATLHLMLYYARRCFPRKTHKVTMVDQKGFYDDDPAEDGETGDDAPVLDPDLQLFLHACKPLLQSRNGAVIVAVASCFLHLGTPDYLETAIGPLVSLLRSPPPIQELALHNIVSIALSHPGLFLPYASHFFVQSTDTQPTWTLKLEIITLLFPYAANHLKSLFLSELEHFAQSSSHDQIRESVRAIGRCAHADPASSGRCFRVLLNQITSFDDVLVSEVLTVIRHLIQQDPPAHKTTIVRLARHLDKTTSPEARATIIWLVGEFAVGDSDIDIAPDVLRILAKGFADESEDAKQQILLLAAKVYLNYLQSQPTPSSDGTAIDTRVVDASSSPAPLSNSSSPPPIPLLWSYILLLTRYDTSYDLRDRARTLRTLLANPSTTQLASLLLLAPKPVPSVPSPSEGKSGLRLGSSMVVLGREGTGMGLMGYEAVPDWVKEGEEPDARLREWDGAADAGGARSGPGGLVEKKAVSASAKLDEAVRERGLTGLVEQGTSRAGGKGKQVSLNDWLDESDESESESGETEEETETESGEEESDEDEASEDDGDRASKERRHLMT